MKRQNGVFQGEMALYRAPDGTVELDVRLERKRIWLRLNQRAGLFDGDQSIISRHLHHVSECRFCNPFLTKVFQFA
jgi:hypothetical protein